MSSKLKMRKKAFNSIEATVCLFMASVVIITYVLKYDLKSDVASRKEIDTLISGSRTARSAMMNSGRSINFKFDKKSYSFYGTTTTDTTTTYFTATRNLKYGEIQTDNDGRGNAPSFGNLNARISKSVSSTRFQTIYYVTISKKYRINCCVAIGRMNVDKIEK